MSVDNGLDCWLHEFLPEGSKISQREVAIAKLGKTSAFAPYYWGDFAC